MTHRRRYDKVEALPYGSASMYEGRQMPRIEDVAREAGVGVGTVSRVLSGRGYVATETRTRILAVCVRLGYQPSSAARALSRRRTHILELVVPPLTRAFYAEILRGIEAGLADTDYSLVIRTIERRVDRDRIFETCGLRGRADGMLLVSLTPTPALVERLAEQGKPLVLVDGEHPGLRSVGVDHEAGEARAARYCIELGHRRVALIDHHEDEFTPVSPTPRQRGLRATMEAAGLAAPPTYERITDFQAAAGGAALDALLDLPEPPTAVLVGSDTQAMGVLDAARRRGLRVPADLSVVGYNDIDPAQYLDLTTVRVPTRALGEQGMALLLTALERPETPPQTVRLPTELVIRGTCGPPPLTRLER
jgi:DNA-binding LacI/PurR family transcriptional regulator